MKCEGCVKAVKNALETQQGVFNAEVSLDSKTAIVTFDTSLVPESGLHAAIEMAGFKVEKAD